MAAFLAAVVAAALATPGTLHAPTSWTQFRLTNSNNAVISGSFSTSWRSHTGAPFSSSPTLSNGVLYIGDNAGVLYAINPVDGKIYWSARVKSPLMSAPLVFDDLVIVGEGDEVSPSAATPAHPIHVGGGTNALLAFDRHTGALRWQVTLPGSGMPTGAIIDGVLVEHNGAGSLYGVDPQTGRVLYTRDLHSIASMTAAVPLGSNRFATLGVDANVLWILQAKDGSIVSRIPLSQNASGFGDCPAASDGKMIFCNYMRPPYASVPMQTDRFAIERGFGVDLSTGKRVWDVYLEFGSLPRRNEAAIPLLAYNTLYFGSSVQPYMHALDPKTGALKWKMQARGPVLGGVVGIGGAIYFGDLGGYLWAVDPNTGAVIGDINEGTPFNVGSPIVAGQTLIIGSRGGTIIAVPLSTIRATHDQ